MAASPPAEGRDWQSNIHGIGILEFMESSSQDEFVDRINEFLPNGDQLSGLHDQETHSRFPTIVDGLVYNVELPNDYGEIFDQVFVHLLIDTNNLIRVLLYGAVDKDTFQKARQEDYKQNNRQLQLENSGLNVLRAAEDELRDFISKEIATGLFTTKTKGWSVGKKHVCTCPGFWFCDLSDSNVDTPSELIDQRDDEAMFLGMGDIVERGGNLTKYANGRCVANRDGGYYLQTTLGSFPFRHILLRLQPEELLDLPWGNQSYDPNGGIPSDFNKGIAPLARSYCHLAWSLKTYYSLEEYSPECTFYNSEHSQVNIHELTDTEKAATLDKLYKTNLELSSFWSTQQQQFESIKTTRREFGGFSNDENSVAHPIVSAATEIESLCAEKVGKYERRHQQLIDRIQSNLDANIGIVSKRLSIVLLIITLINVILAIPQILAGPYPFTLSIVIGCAFLIVVGILFQEQLESAMRVRT